MPLLLSDHFESGVVRSTAEDLRLHVKHDRLLARFSWHDFSDWLEQR